MVDQRGRTSMEGREENGGMARAEESENKHSLTVIGRCCDMIVKSLERLFFW